MARSGAGGGRAGRPPHVQAHHRVPALGLDRLGRSEVLTTGVVDQDVDAAVALQHGVDDLDRLVAHVARNGRAALADLPRRRVQDLRPAPDDHH
jgi:phosphate uptake regulator